METLTLDGIDDQHLWGVLTALGSLSLLDEHAREATLEAPNVETLANIPTIVLRGGDWFARFTAALMLGPALGGIFLGCLGDRIGRKRALGISILFYSVYAGLGALVKTQEQMLGLRFVVGLGVGGVWPNAVALAAECWPDKSRPMVAGLMGVALNGGILMLSQIARTWHITPESWRWIFYLAAAPALLGLLVLVALPESPLWLASRRSQRQKARHPPRGAAISDSSRRLLRERATASCANSSAHRC